MLRSLCLVFPLLFVLPGCAASLLGALLLSQSDTDDLVANFEESTRVQERMAQFAFEMATGQVDPATLAYVAPILGNGHVGSVVATARDLGWGVGDTNLTFTVTLDGQPIDPFAIDLDDPGVIAVQATINFIGTSLLGTTLTAGGTVNATSAAHDAAEITATFDTDIDVSHDGYDYEYVADELTLTIDRTTDEVTNALGSIRGEVDIPDFPFDADFEVLADGVDSSVQVALDAAESVIRYTLDLGNIF